MTERLILGTWGFLPGDLIKIGKVLQSWEERLSKNSEKLVFPVINENQVVDNSVLCLEHPDPNGLKEMVTTRIKPLSQANFAFRRKSFWPFHVHLRDIEKVECDIFTAVFFMHTPSAFSSTTSFSSQNTSPADGQQITCSRKVSPAIIQLGWWERQMHVDVSRENVSLF